MQRSVGLRPLHASLVILGVVFASELALMLTFDVLPPLPNLLEALVNAVVLLLILGGLLYVYVYKPMRQQIRDRDLAIASLRESEQRFQDIAQAADEWIWEVDANGRYTYASPVVERVLGYTPEEVLSKHFYDLFHPDERETAKAEAFAVFAQKMPFHGFINRNRHKNGASVWLSTTGVPTAAVLSWITPVYAATGMLQGHTRPTAGASPVSVAPMARWRMRMSPSAERREGARACCAKGAPCGPGPRRLCGEARRPGDAGPPP